MQSKAQTNKNLLGLSAGVSHQKHSGQGKLKGNLGWGSEHAKSKRKGMLQVFEELGNKDWGRKATEVEAKLFLFFFSFFILNLNPRH